MVDTELEELLQARQQSKAAQDAAQQKNQELRQKVKDGSYSTGDSIKDYLLAAFGVIEEPEFEAKLRRWQEAVQLHQGEQVLVVGETYKKHGEDGCFSSSYYLLSGRYLQLGIINGTVGWEYAKSQVIIPTEKTVKMGSGFVSEYHSEYSPQWNLHSEHLTIEAEDLFTSRLNQGNRFSQCEVLVGNRQVELYFYLNRIYGEGTLEKIAEGYERETPKWNLDLGYVPALELLKLEVPFDFKIAADKEDPQRQENIFREIYELTLKPGTEPQTLKQKVEYALQAGIHEKYMVMEGPRRGISIHSAEFLRGLCEEYQIPILKKENQEQTPKN